jgi:hypothetical protein
MVPVDNEQGFRPLQIAAPVRSGLMTVLRIVVLSVALTGCASPSSGPLEPGTVQTHMSGESHTLFGIASPR